MASDTGGRRPVPLSAPHLAGNEWRYVRECLDSTYVSSVGAFVGRFEEMVAARCGVRHAVATTSGTAALHVALLVAGVEPGDEVLVSDLTFIAPANAVCYLGAVPVFIDAEPEHLQMDPAKLAEFLRGECGWRDGVLRNRRSGRRVRAIVPVHILGQTVAMGPVLELARAFGLAVVEDAAEALGARWRDRAAGALGDIGCFSFNGNKVITTGGGGMIVTGRADWAARARYLTTQAKDDPHEYIHREIGFNYRLSNVLAALGCAQLELLDGFIENKRAIAARYLAAFPPDGPIRSLPEAAEVRGNGWLHTVWVDPARAGFDSRGLLRHLRANGIESRPLWQPMHLAPAHAGRQACCGEVAEQAYRHCLSLPSSVDLTPATQDAVIAAIRSCPPGTAA